MNVMIADGKYTVVCDEVNGLRALRYGQEWRDLAGDHLVAELALEVEKLRAALEAQQQASVEPVRVGNDASSALRFAAQVVELYDDATMQYDYMIDSRDCAGVLTALADYFTLFPVPQLGLRKTR